MRKLKLQVQMTIDGFIAGVSGEMDWMIWDWDEELKNYVRALTDQVDCIVLGRKLAEGFIPHWASLPETEEQDGVAKMNNTKKVVFTKTMETSTWANSVLAKGDLVHEMEELKKESGQDIIAYGGAGFVSALIENGLIDEFHLFINPVAIGQGLTIFKSLKNKLDLVLVNSRAFSCGISVLHYESRIKAN